jgi:hypothetical protein
MFAAALCTGVAMVGLSVHGLMGIDTELAHQAVAARQQQMLEYHSVHYPRHHHGGCDAAAPASKRI